MKTIVIIAAGGSGSRMNAGINKVLLPLCGKTVLRRSMEAFAAHADRMVVTARPEDMEAVRREIESAPLPFPVVVAEGGASRQESVLNGLRAADCEPADVVMVHDGARCMADTDMIERVLGSCLRSGSGVPVLPVTDTIKECGADGTVLRTQDRSVLFKAQTPQAFRYRELLEASEQAARDGFTATDDASVMEHAGFPVHTVEGSPRNIKLTSREDLMEAQRMIEQQVPVFRVGHGYDVHRLVPDRKLVLCGVDIPWEVGLLGHSDADVALHALMDAMLGAAAMGDIGQHFPDTDPAYRDISSIILLKETNRIIRENGYSVVNADITIAAQKPKLLPHIPDMRKNVAAALGCPVDSVSVKATTTEKLGFEGRMEGISAQAVCLIQGTASVSSD